MRVFVWISYGNSSVYYAETQEDLRDIYNTVRDVLRDFYTPEEFIETFGPEPGLDFLMNLQPRHVTGLIDTFGGFGQHEIFEWGTEFTKLLGR
jgi:hypothetical protein